MVDYPKVETFAGKFAAGQSENSELKANNSNMIHKAKNSIIKEKYVII